MSREIIEFSDLIDEQFEPVAANTAGFWPNLMSWFANLTVPDQPSETTVDYLVEIKTP